MDAQEARHLVHCPHFRCVNGCVQDDHAPRVEQKATQRFDPLPLQGLVNQVDASPVQEDVVISHEAGRQHVRPEEEDHVEHQGSTDTTEETHVLHIWVFRGGERQPSQGAGHAQHSGSQGRADQSAK